MLQLAVWDTGGIERFRAATTQLSSLYRNADAAVFVYSVDEPLSLHSLASWLQDLQCFGPDAMRFLVGNKSDLEMEVDESAAKSFAISRDLSMPFLISAKTNDGVLETFQSIASRLHRQFCGSQVSDSSNVDLMEDSCNKDGDDGCSC